MAARILSELSGFQIQCVLFLEWQLFLPKKTQKFALAVVRQMLFELCFLKNRGFFFFVQGFLLSFLQKSMFA